MMDANHFLRRGLGMEGFAEIVLENVLDVNELFEMLVIEMFSINKNEVVKGQ